MKKLLMIPLFMLVLSGCGEKGAIKDTFCGLGIDARYCKCAFHGEYCKDINMNKGEAKDFVYEKYDEWKNPDMDKLKKECNDKNGALFGKTCMLCKQTETVQDNKCVPTEEIKDEPEEIVENTEEDVKIDEEKKGECKYDNECDAICEGNIMWKMGCDAQTNKCIKTFDTNCSSDVEVFGDLKFPKICTKGKCVRDTQSIKQMKKELQALKDESIDDAKLTNAQRQELQALMLEANKNCINGIADMTNVAIVEFGTRIGSLMAGGLPSMADASVDYINDAANKLTAQNDTSLPVDKKLKPDEYIKLNCDMYNYFKNYLTATGTELDNEIDNAKEINNALQLLP